MGLPQEFLERMQVMLEDEYEAFLRACGEQRKFGLRVNTLKISVEEFVKLVPFHLKKIPWTDNGFYYEKEDDPARHPFYYAGLYYLQEPSAMAPAAALPVAPGERVLDLCAAPGGKATALASKLGGRGLLVANEISASRAKALLKNLEVFGVTNSFVTNAAPHRLAEQFPEAFDRILVDAPCSGEGMFRKDPASAKAWSVDRILAYAKTQREIVRQAVRMLRPGGTMLYSTCTFSPEENEGTVAYLLRECPELELLEIPGCGAFSEGRPEYLERILAAGESGRLSGTDRELLEGFPVGQERDSRELRRCVRIFPHCAGGEGHFMALLRKRGGDFPRARAACAATVPAAGMRDRGGSEKDAARALREFFEDVRTGWSAGQIEVRGAQAYYVPEPPPVSGGLPFLRNGLYLGEIRRGRFEPSQAFAMALRQDEYASVIRFAQDDARVRRYLCGETVEADDLPSGRPSGWQLVTVCGYPLGWGKLVNGTLKNKLHPGWRMPG